MRYSTQDKKGEVISYKAVFSEARPDENAASQPLPDDWEASCNASIKVFGQHMTKINTRFKNSKQATAAKKALHDIRDAFSPQEGSELKNLIVWAWDAIDKGNRDIINRVLKVASELPTNDGVLLGITAEEVTTALKAQLEHIMVKVGQQLGTPFVYLGISL